jgi:hypothetical protein
MDDNFESKLHLYLRSERAMLDVFIRDKSRQLSFVFMGFIALLTALVMFDIAVFFTLMAYFTIKITAFILAGANTVLFLMLICFSKRKKHQKEVEALQDIRDFSKDEVTKDLKIAKDEVVEISHSVGGVVRDVSSIFNGELLGLTRLITMIRDLIKS